MIVSRIPRHLAWRFREVDFATLNRYAHSICQIPQGYEVLRAARPLYTSRDQVNTLQPLPAYEKCRRGKIYQPKNEEFGVDKHKQQHTQTQLKISRYKYQPTRHKVEVNKVKYQPTNYGLCSNNDRKRFFCVRKPVTIRTCPIQVPAFTLVFKTKLQEQQLVIPNSAFHSFCASKRGLTYASKSNLPCRTDYVRIAPVLNFWTKQFVITRMYGDDGKGKDEELKQILKDVHQDFKVEAEELEEFLKNEQELADDIGEIRKDFEEDEKNSDLNKNFVTSTEDYNENASQVETDDSEWSSDSDWSSSEFSSSDGEMALSESSDVDYSDDDFSEGETVRYSDDILRMESDGKIREEIWSSDLSDEESEGLTDGDEYIQSSDDDILLGDKNDEFSEYSDGGMSEGLTDGDSDEFPQFSDDEMYESADEEYIGEMKGTDSDGKWRKELEVNHDELFRLKKEELERMSPEEKDLWDVDKELLKEYQVERIKDTLGKYLHGKNKDAERMTEMDKEILDVEELLAEKSGEAQEEEIEEFVDYDEEALEPIAEPWIPPVDLIRGTEGVYDLPELLTVLREANSKDICVIKMAHGLDLGDYMVIVSATSYRHMKAIAADVKWIHKRKKEASDVSLKVEGLDNSREWFAMDLGNIILHIFMPEVRENYDLETLWTVGPEHDEKSVGEINPYVFSVEDLPWLQDVNQPPKHPEKHV